MDDATVRLLDEAAGYNRGLESLANEGLGAFERANPFVRMFVMDMVKRGVGMSLKDLRARVHEMTSLIEGVRSGEVALEQAKPRFAEYAGLARRTIGFVEGLEPMTARIKDPAQRAVVTTMARERVEDTRRLAGVLDQLAAR